MNRRHLIWSIVLLVALGTLATETILASRNTLSRHTRLQLAKQLQSPPVLGAYYAANTRNLTARNRLNLQEWHGHHEILLPPAKEPKSFSCRFRLGEGAYLAIIAQRTAHQAVGFRLSRSPWRPSMSFRAKDDEFLTRDPLNNLTITDRWHQAKVTYQKDEILLSLDGKMLAKMPREPLEKHGFSVRSGRFFAVVDDLRVVGKDGALLLDENMANRQNWWPVAFILVGCPLILGAILVLSRPEWLRRALLMELSLLILLGSWHAFDYWVWSSRYHFPVFASLTASYDRTHPWERLRSTVAQELKFLDPQDRPSRSRFYQVEGTKCQEGTANHPGRRLHLVAERSEQISAERFEVEHLLKLRNIPQRGRVLLMGTSQTFGEGAPVTEARMDHFLGQALRRNLGPGVTVIGAASRGMRAKDLSEQLPEYLEATKPALVVFNLGTNDVGYQDQFRGYLQDLLKTSREAGVRVLLVQEANSPAYGKQIEGMHEIMKAVAREEQVDCIDLHGELKSEALYDSGFLWWDAAHLTSYGQKLAADFLAREISARFQELLSPEG